MMVLPFLLASWATLALLNGPRDRPPPVNFEKPEDYVGWIIDYLSRERTENAADLYTGFFPDANGVGGFPLPSESIDLRIKSLVNGPIWSEEDHQELAAYLKNSAPFMDILRGASKHPHYWFPVPRNTRCLFDVQMPSHQCSRAAARAMIVLAWRKQDDQPTALIRTWEEVLKHATHMRNGGTFIYALMGESERALVFQFIRAALADRIIQGDDIGKTSRTIDACAGMDLELVRPLGFEWASILDALQFLFPDGRFNEDSAKAFSKSTGTPLQSRPFDPTTTAEMVDDHFLAMSRIASKGLKREVLRRLDEQERKNARRWESNVFLDQIMPSLGRAFHLLCRIETERRGTLLTLALVAYHEEHKKWPTKLAQLGSEEIADWRKDPFSDKPFMYKLKDDKPLLYSVAENGEDDGGRHDPKWGEGEKGGDYVFWPFQRPE